MSERPSYLVIIGPQGLFSAHWTEDEAFKMVAKLKDPDAYVIEVPETDGTSVPWRLEEPKAQRPIEEAAGR